MPLAFSVGKAEGVTVFWGGRAQPDVQTFNLLLSAISKAVTNGKGSLRDAGKVLTEMEQTGVQLNVYTFNSLLNVLTTSAAQAQSQVEVSDVEDVMLRMRDADVTPDVVRFLAMEFQLRCKCWLLLDFSRTNMGLAGRYRSILGCRVLQRSQNKAKRTCPMANVSSGSSRSITSSRYARKKRENSTNLNPS